MCPQKWRVRDGLVKMRRAVPANKRRDGSIKSSAGTKGMWKHVVVRCPVFWPPLEVLPSLTWSWTSATPRLLDGPDKVNLELIPLLFPFKMHVKLTEPHKSCPRQSHDDNICDVVASRSTSMLHFRSDEKNLYYYQTYCTFWTIACIFFSCLDHLVWYFETAFM